MGELEKYEVLEKIGHGSFGVIRKVRRKEDGHILCRKEISYAQMSSKEREQLQAELSILKGLRHPNIVAYYEREHIKASSDLHIYMEFCEHGDLGKYIRDLKRSNKTADEDFVWSVFSQLVSALHRCHYGEDPPDVGRNVMGLSNDAKPSKGKTTHAMILHRDLKPENIFLGSDASVKLGDFGLSKIMQSHDFASTYVGTPFYMSPEICAAEQYSLHSDIWAFGCIMYELCSKEPPFNAKTHMELISKIRLGKVAQLSTHYSPELRESIARCLRVNPHARPDTTQLLNIPMVKLKRKELEIVRVSKQLKTREEQASKALLEAERKIARTDIDRQAIRSELDQIVRREWEVKARLEIDRQVQLGLIELQRSFDARVNRSVAEELSRQKLCELDRQHIRSSTPDHEEMPSNIPLISHHQSQSTCGETDDFPSSTDLSELSLESPTTSRSKHTKKSNRTPFGRAQTMFAGSPMDIQMIDPSPAPIASLGLSPRHRAVRKPSSLSRNIFASAAAEAPGSKSSPEESDEDTNNFDDDDDDDEFDDLDDIPILTSPTRLKQHGQDPFKALGRPGLLRQRTAPPKQFGQQNLLTAKAASKESAISTIPTFSRPVPGPTTTSPNQRRLSKLPSASALPHVNESSTSPTRKALLPISSTSPTRQAPSVGRPLSRKRVDDLSNTTDLRQPISMNSQMQGRTLVELAQARTGIAVQDFGEKQDLKRPLSGGDSDNERRNSPPVWDPEQDEMPSPFLDRRSRHNLITASTASGPGFRHLR